ncbi:putative sensor domain DACNV-containing protein [Pedobacter sp. UC225_65]|uniref:putative sensor domain DACNV-containing protein n=1 Tax=Pedobacter sp. UC225_65 TaxID=3350173 RepID=UPI00366D7A5F
MNSYHAKPKELAMYVFKYLEQTKKKNKPSIPTLEELFDVMFYASMNTEEGEMIKVNIIYFNPNSWWHPTNENLLSDEWRFAKFDMPIEFNIKNLVKLAKAADPWSSSLAVFADDSHNLQIYGMIDQSLHTQSYMNHETDFKPDQAGIFQATITGIGNLAVIYRFDLIATLKHNVLVTEFLDVLRSGPIAQSIKSRTEYQRKDLGSFRFNSKIHLEHQNLLTNVWRSAISRLLIHVRNYNHGGAILITDNFDEIKIKYPIQYGRLSHVIYHFALTTKSNESLLKQIQDFGDSPIDNSKYQMSKIFEELLKSSSNELKGAIRFIASQSCVDGLIIFNNKLDVEGFGGVIKKIDPPETVYQADNAIIRKSKLIERSTKEFGTRHQSMISFCWHNPNSFGFVISQDGDIRAIKKVEDKLIIWENIKTQRYLKVKSKNRVLKSWQSFEQINFIDSP